MSDVIRILSRLGLTGVGTTANDTLVTGIQDLVTKPIQTVVDALPVLSSIVGEFNDHVVTPVVNAFAANVVTPIEDFIEDLDIPGSVTGTFDSLIVTPVNAFLTAANIPAAVKAEFSEHIVTPLETFLNESFDPEETVVETILQKVINLFSSWFEVQG